MTKIIENNPCVHPALCYLACMEASLMDARDESILGEMRTNATAQKAVERVLGHSLSLYEGVSFKDLVDAQELVSPDLRKLVEVPCL